MSKNVSGIIYSDDFTIVESSHKNIKIANIMDSAKEINPYALSNCYLLEYIYLPEGLEFIGNMAFLESKVKKMIIPKSIKEITEGTFFSCQELEEIILSENLEKIGIAAFEKCVKLRQIIIPKSVKVVRDRAFKDCTNLEKVIYKGTLEDFKNVKIGKENKNFVNLAYKTLIEKEQIIKELKEELGDSFSIEELNLMALEEILN